MAEVEAYLVEGGTRTPLPPGEVFADLDSSGVLESPPKQIEIACQPGAFLDGVTLSFRGPSARFWGMTLTDPALAGESPPEYESRLENLFVDGRPETEQRLTVWIRATTEPGEPPADDRSSPLLIEYRLRVGEAPEA